MADRVAHLRVLRPAANVLAFYDGRVEGHRWADEPNWVDEGALSLGIASYAIVDGGEALVYDTHISVAHGRAVRAAIGVEGGGHITVVLSHNHLDHVAGTAVFADSEVVATKRTALHLRHGRRAIENGTLEGPPAIDPLILPSETFEGRMELRVGGIEVELVQFEIHSDDAAVMWLPERRLMFAGDTLEDTVTYVDEPERLEVHLTELERMRAMKPERILPNHGDPDVIAAGGYGPELIDATREYIELLLRMRDEPALAELGLRELLSGPIEAGALHWYEPYEAVHRGNVEKVLAS